MRLEGSTSVLRNGKKRFRPLTDEGLLHLDVAASLERGEVCAQVAVRQQELFFEEAEVHLIGRSKPTERAHNAEPRWLMDHGIEFAHVHNGSG